MQAHAPSVELGSKPRDPTVTAASKSRGLYSTAREEERGPRSHSEWEAVSCIHGQIAVSTRVLKDRVDSRYNALNVAP